ncbi:hypothetical protein Hanom_Chr12g01177641 [Helianthus anomalus]
MEVSHVSWFSALPRSSRKEVVPRARWVVENFSNVVPRPDKNQWHLLVSGTGCPMAASWSQIFLNLRSNSVTKDDPFCKSRRVSRSMCVRSVER